MTAANITQHDLLWAILILGIVALALVIRRYWR